ncbi:hypothetical protein COTS27_01279 [Spirochaetota bacterium]|nr:hypothetical protein COTS27_01279 [Spirochaetota bacterium]
MGRDIPKIVYMGSPLFAARLLEFIITMRLADVCAVWTVAKRIRSRVRNRKALRSDEESTPVGQVAQRLNITLHEPEEITALDVAAMRGYEADFIFIVAYGKILPEAFFAAARYGAYNLHFSLLPRYRGAAPITAAILNGDRETGITIQKVVKRMDAGPIVLQEAFAAAELDYEQVLRHSIERAHNLFQVFFTSQVGTNNSPLWAAPRLLEQNETKATYTKKIDATATEMTQAETSLSFHRKMLAFKHWRGVMFFIKEVKYFVVTYQFLRTENFYQSPLFKADQSFAAQTKTLLTDIEWEAWNGKTTVPLHCFKSLKQCFYLLTTQNKRLFLWLNGDLMPIEILTLKRAGGRTITAKDFINGSREKFPIAVN